MSEFEELDNIDKPEDEQPEQPDEQPQPEPDPEEFLTPQERQKLMIERQKLKNKVLRYKELFPDYMRNIEFKLEDLDNMDIEQLENLIEELGVIVNTRNSSNLTQMLYFTSINVVEAGSTRFGLQVAGLTEALKQNRAVIDCLNEISLIYENDMYMRPEIRLAYLTSQTIIQLHNLNKSGQTISNYLNKKVPDEIVNKYKDL